MRRLLVLLAALLGATLVLSGCEANGTPYAAKVASKTVTPDALNATLSTISTNTLARCVFTSGSLKGAGNGNYNMGFVATVLTFIIQRDVLANANARLGLGTSSLARSVSGQLLDEALASVGSTCAPNVNDITAELPARFRNLLSSYETDQALYAAHLAGTVLTPSSLAAFAASHPNAVGVACASEIVVSSSATADSIAAKIHAGTSFASLARSSSLDTSNAANGGTLGCGPSSTFPAPFANAIINLAAGQVSPPFAVEGATGSTYYAIVTVTSRKAGTSLDSALGAVTYGNTLLEGAINHLSANGVLVDPAYGHWGLLAGTYSVIGPSGPNMKFVKNLAALSPPTTTTIPG